MIHSPNPLLARSTVFIRAQPEKITFNGKQDSKRERETGECKCMKNTSHSKSQLEKLVTELHMTELL
jgi:hypothetical protein